MRGTFQYSTTKTDERGERRERDIKSRPKKMVQRFRLLLAPAGSAGIMRGAANRASQDAMRPSGRGRVDWVFVSFETLSQDLPSRKFRSGLFGWAVFSEGRAGLAVWAWTGLVAGFAPSSRRRGHGKETGDPVKGGVRVRVMAE